MFFRRKRPQTGLFDVDIGNGRKRAFRHRETLADIGVIRQHFQNRDYDLSRLRRGAELASIYDRIVKVGCAPVILDCGANIGASVVHFAIEFPQARIVAFEPNKDNYRLLKINSEGLNVETYLAAVDAENGRAALFDPGEGEWGYRTSSDPAGEVEVVGINNFVLNNLKQSDTPFIAKFDIEGAEKGLFEHSTDWIDRFPLLIVELHDWLLPSQGTSHNFLQAIANRNRDFVYIGEDIYSIKN